jgi:hypothetical protein
MVSHSNLPRQQNSARPQLDCCSQTSTRNLREVHQLDTVGFEEPLTLLDDHQN